MSPRPGLPPQYFPLAILALFGELPATFIDHDGIHPSGAGLWVIVIALTALARHSRAAWALLAAWNVFVAFSAATAFGGRWQPGVPLLLLNALVCLALLVAPSMRSHVAARQSRRGDRIGPARTL